MIHKIFIWPYHYNQYKHDYVLVAASDEHCYYYICRKLNGKSNSKKAKVLAFFVRGDNLIFSFIQIKFIYNIFKQLVKFKEKNIKINSGLWVVSDDV